jgi:hypothetical protein
MRATSTSAGCRRRSSKPRARLIRELCSERARLREEVKQLMAAIHIYRELASRTLACSPPKAPTDC